MRDDVRGLLIKMYRVVDIMISVTKQMEAADANVCRGGLQNDNEELWVIHRAMAAAFRLAHDAGAAFVTKNLVAAQLKRSAHLVQRNCHHSPHDLQTEFHGSGHWFSPTKVEILWVRALTVREKAFRCCCCCCWQPQGLLICNSWFF